MKLKSLLFGSAAVLAAGTGAQAADLPVAEPVEYVRICDAFGAGFYYIPGTDTCLRIGGNIRVESHYVFSDDVGDEDYFDFDFGFDINPDDEDFNNYTTRARGLVEWDARTQTDFGLIRAYIAYNAFVGPDDDDESYSAGTVDLDDVFIQVAHDWGTFKAGHTGSNFDFIGTSTFGTRIDVDDPTGDATQFAYTFALGDSGVSATFAIEDPSSANRNQERNFLGLGIGGTEDYEGKEYPDGVGNIRIDGGWGSAQLMGAVHTMQDEEFGPVDDDTEIGFAVGGGLTLNVPFIQNMSVRVQAGYADGALGYVTNDPGGLGDFHDGVTNEAVSVQAGFDIGLTEKVLFAADGSYTNVQDNADGFEYDYWAAVANLRYTPVKGLYFGIEGEYNRIEADTGVGGLIDDDIFGVMTRVNRSF